MKEDASLKEIMCALIAIAILVATGETLLWLYDEAASSAFKPEIYQRHSQLLNVVIGMAGSVVGYYFGRVPSERLAQSAQGQVADAARKEGAATATTQQIKADVQSARDLLPRPGSPLGGGGPQPQTPSTDPIWHQLNDILKRY